MNIKELIKKLAILNAKDEIEKASIEQGMA